MAGGGSTGVGVDHGTDAVVLALLASPSWLLLLLFLWVFLRGP